MAQKTITHLNIDEFDWMAYQSILTQYANTVGSTVHDILKAIYIQIKREKFTLLVGKNCLILLKAERKYLDVPLSIGTNADAELSKYMKEVGLESKTVRSK